MSKKIFKLRRKSANIKEKNRTRISRKEQINADFVGKTSVFIRFFRKIRVLSLLVLTKIGFDELRITALPDVKKESLLGLRRKRF